MAELGLMGIPIPEEYGGAGGDTLSYAIAIEELTRIDSSVAITVAAHTSLGTMPIFLFGTDEQKRANGCPTSPRVGGSRLRTDGAGRRVRRGRDAHDGGAPGRPLGRQRRRRSSSRTPGRTSPACVTITARTGEDEISNLDRPERHARLRDLGADEEARLAGVRHPRALVHRTAPCPRATCSARAEQGFRQFLEILDGGRSPWRRWASDSHRAPTTSRLRTRSEREQFGRPIASFQAIRFKLADMATEIEAGRALVYKAAWLKDQGRPFALEAAMAKLYTGELSNRVVNASLQIHGGYGYMDEFAISRLYRDQKILEIGEGTNEVQRMVIARHLGL